MKIVKYIETQHPYPPHPWVKKIITVSLSNVFIICILRSSLKPQCGNSSSGGYV